MMNTCKIYILLLITLLTSISFTSGEKYTLTLSAGQAKRNKKTTEFVEKSGDKQVKLARLKDETEDRIFSSTENDPDIVYQLQLPAAGKYRLFMDVVREKEIEPGVPVYPGYAKLQIGKQRLTRRIVSDAHHYSGHELGTFELAAKEKLKIWLPKHISFESLRIEAYNPDPVPQEVAAYAPPVTPPAGRPRLWVNEATLPVVKERLTKGENLAIWQELQEQAREVFDFKVNPREEIFYYDKLEDAVKIKAFYYLMTNDRRTGEEAKKLLTGYLSVLEYGNIKQGDITRQIGKTIYTTALVYDWCNDLLSEQEKDYLFHHLMRLAPDMEIGWPPFKENIVNGHANEAQVNRDLLAMSIAIYDKDPEPYRYTSYMILEQLVPMKAFENQSQRHNQGYDYGAYRHGWVMHAAWFFYRMTGRPVFHENITNYRNYWLYMRLPDGTRLADGDGFAKPHPAYAETLLLDYAYANDPVLKAEFGRRGGMERAKINPVLFLLLNDPDLEAGPRLDTLPLTNDFGPVLGSMIARTGWNMEKGSNDVIAEIKGGGYHFGNHQHADAGSMQIYYHGPQLGDVGIYYYYGAPYDFNFNKRSVAHSMMLVKDPGEALHPRTKINDGGTRFNQRIPQTPREVVTDPWFNNGTILSSDFEAGTATPSYSYFKADLSAAYSDKVSRYTRSFCFLNLDNQDIPAVIILADDLTVSDPGFEKYWKINAFNRPEQSDSTIVLHNSRDGITGYTHINMLLPLAGDRTIEISSFRDSTNVLGPQYQIRSDRPEAKAWQVVAYPKDNKSNNRFLTVFQMASEGIPPLPIDFIERDNVYTIRIQDRIVCMSAGYKEIEHPFTLSIEEGTENKVLLANLKPGTWEIHDVARQTKSEFTVEKGKNTIFFIREKGEYHIIPPC